MKEKFILLLLLIFLFLSFYFQKKIAINAKILLFISEQFPIPIKPLGLITSEPVHEKIELESKNGKIVADLFLPRSSEQKPAVIIAMGVKTAEKDEPIILSLGDTLARLGYVAFWPRLEKLDKQEALPEEPETFVKSFEYLGSLRKVNDKRISFVGFSVGSSIAMVSSEDKRIADKVRSLVFFGGYYDIFDYLKSLESKTSEINGRTISWKPNEGTNHINEILKNLGIKSIEEALNSPLLNKYNPSENIEALKAKNFILHDKNDSYVHYFEGEKLNKELEGKIEKEFLIVDLFEHVQPKKLLTLKTLGELSKLYGFLYKVLEYL